MLGLSLCWSISGARAFDDDKYPDLSGQWLRTDTGTPRYDPSKPAGRGQQAPLTPEYQAILEASLKDQANGGQGNWMSGARCLPPGMPATMNGYNSMEIVAAGGHLRLGRARSAGSTAASSSTARLAARDRADLSGLLDRPLDGYDRQRPLRRARGRDARASKLRSLDNSGLPLHADNQTVIKERIYFDKSDPGLLHDEMTMTDHALTRPWNALKSYRRSAERYPVWREENCPEITLLTKIGDQIYFKGADDNLLPTRKNQPPPDLRYFKQTPK